MPWIQLILQTNKADNEKAEQALLDAGALSVTNKDAEDKPILEPLPGETPLWENIILSGLFEADINTDLLQLQIKTQLGENIPLKFEALEDKDWVRAWMDDYKPMQFGKRLWVCPKHIPPPQPDAINLMLDPGLAFGTGTHPTTALCLEWLDSADVKNKQVLDFGCGSGVLAIAALLLGADHCDATDIDPQAILATNDNAQENGFWENGFWENGFWKNGFSENSTPENRTSKNNVAEKLNCFLSTDMPTVQPAEKYDMVLANILAGPLTELAEQLASYCKPGGNIVLSGILQTQSDKIITAYSPWFNLDPIVAKEDWIRVTGRKK